MKRLHVHVSVDDLDANIQFYSTVFGAPPSVVKPDYAKWMVDDPRVNFAISKRGSARGIDHLGVQVESDEELTALREQLAGAQMVALVQSDAACCDARSDKYWTTDPQGIAWETFHTLDQFLFTATRYARRRALAAVPRQAPKPRPANPVRAACKGDSYETGNFKCSVFVHRQFCAQHYG
jgi:catechol 2,3-dioxygenase-like lactoylglutathione lyase family enzyme